MTCDNCHTTKYRHGKPCLFCNRREYYRLYMARYRAKKANREEELELVDLLFANDVHEMVMSALASNIDHSIRGLK